MFSPQDDELLSCLARMLEHLYIFQTSSCRLAAVCQLLSHPLHHGNLCGLQLYFPKVTEDEACILFRVCAGLQRFTASDQLPTANPEESINPRRICRIIGFDTNDLTSHQNVEPTSSDTSNLHLGQLEDSGETFAGINACEEKDKSTTDAPSGSDLFDIALGRVHQLSPDGGSDLSGKVSPGESGVVGGIKAHHSKSQKHSSDEEYSVSPDCKRQKLDVNADIPVSVTTSQPSLSLQPGLTTSNVLSGDTSTLSPSTAATSSSPKASCSYHQESLLSSSSSAEDVSASTSSIAETSFVCRGLSHFALFLTSNSYGTILGEILTQWQSLRKLAVVRCEDFFTHADLQRPKRDVNNIGEYVSPG